MRPDPPGGTTRAPRAHRPSEGTGSDRRPSLKERGRGPCPLEVGEFDLVAAITVRRTRRDRHCIHAVISGSPLLHGWDRAANARHARDIYPLPEMCDMVHSTIVARRLFRAVFLGGKVLGPGQRARVLRLMKRPLQIAAAVPLHEPGERQLGSWKNAARAPRHPSQPNDIVAVFSGPVYLPWPPGSR